MRIGILHHDLEWTEEQMKGVLQDKFGAEVRMFDVRDVALSDIESFGPDLVFNRVYASVANRDYSSLNRTLDILRGLRDLNFLIVNSYEASLSDYSKNYAFNLMEQEGISTPRTVVYEDGMDLDFVVRKLDSFPIIVKRDSGGRGVDLKKCGNLEETEVAIKTILDSEDYNGEIILQKFCRPIEANDYRVWVVGGEVMFYHKRSLISVNDGEDPWLASRSLGSEILPPSMEVPEDLKKFCEIAASAIGANLDVLDVIDTEEGYCVIEHNPTPNLRPEYEKIPGINLIEKLAGE